MRAILFDLDGTLLPMDTEGFTRAYFGALAAEVAPLGLKPDALVSAVWAGTKAMVLNDGARLNREAFWEVFTARTGMPRETIEPVCDRFYSEGFHAARSATGPNPLAREAVRQARLHAEKVALATNPLFPPEGQATRLSWIGLAPEDFDLVTHYGSDVYCKPNPAYYTDVCRRLNVSPADCLMIGNDENEDMYAASSLGMRCYLVTDCLLPSRKHPWQGERGSFAEMVAMLKNL